MESRISDTVPIDDDESDQKQRDFGIQCTIKKSSSCSRNARKLNTATKKILRLVGKICILEKEMKNPIAPVATDEDTDSEGDSDRPCKAGRVVYKDISMTPHEEIFGDDEVGEEIGDEEFFDQGAHSEGIETDTDDDEDSSKHIRQDYL
eukprot:gene15940-7266_t